MPYRIISSAISSALAAVLIISASWRAAAQDWPMHPIVMVVPFVAGGSIDIPARRLAAELTLKIVRSTMQIMPLFVP